MRDINPFALLGVGFLLLILGVVLPALMVIEIVESTFFLNIVAYSASLLGMVIGFIGSVMLFGRSRKK